jgi:hypothetical protein
MKGLIVLAGVAASLGLCFEAQACGGCFGPPTSPTLVTGHRMAFAVSDTRTVLWDQFEYEGDPEDFSWVLPVLPGAYVEVADGAWLTALDTFTSTIVTPPQLNCPMGGGFDDEDSGGGCGCAPMGGDDEGGALAPTSGSQQHQPPPVTVVRQETVGPYDTVVLRSTDPDALRAWLTSHDYVVPEEIEPVIDAYVSEGNDFLALRLSPGVGVRQMQPVRVITPGGDYLLPLRMVAAGVGSLVDIKLFVIAEQRYAMPDIAEVTVPLNDLTYDFATNTHNYLELRAAALAQNRGKSYVTSYARSAAFFRPNQLPTGANQTYSLADNGNIYASATTLGEMYFDQAALDVGDYADCQPVLSLLSSTKAVVDSCPEGETCDPAPSDALTADDFVCLEHSDLATALVGMTPAKVWVTRMEMNLPSTALDADCEVEPAIAQAEVAVAREPAKLENPPCSSGLRASFSGPFSGFSLALALLLRRRPRRSPT